MREIKFRAWDSAAEVMSYGKRELFDDSLGFRFEHFECDEPIFMQYTGLKDSDGKEVYEGDIVRFADLTLKSRPEFTGVVESRPGAFVIDSGYATYRNWINLRVVVIGTIHEHPHLIEEGIDEVGSAFDNGKTITVKGRNMGHYSPKLNLEPLEGDE